MSRIAEDGVFEYNGNGGPWVETIADVLELLRDGWPNKPSHAPEPAIRYDGSVVCRIHPWDFWRMQAHAGWRAPIIEKGGRRIIDLSTLLPDAARTLHIFADSKQPYGRIQLESPTGQLLARITD